MLHHVYQSVKEGNPCYKYPCYLQVLNVGYLVLIIGKILCSLPLTATVLIKRMVYLRTKVLHGFSILLFFGNRWHQHMKGNCIHVYTRISYECANELSMRMRAGWLTVGSSICLVSVSGDKSIVISKDLCVDILLADSHNRRRYLFNALFCVNV